jgi:hypothetical protein
MANPEEPPLHEADRAQANIKKLSLEQSGARHQLIVRRRSRRPIRNLLP